MNRGYADFADEREWRAMVHKSNLQYPDMRTELLSGLTDIARSNILDGNRPFLDFAVHFLFDDTNLSEDAADNIGVFLYDSEEALAITEVVKALDHLFHVHGLRHPLRSHKALF